MKISRKDFLGTNKTSTFSYENTAEKLAIDFESEVFLRMKALSLKKKDLASLMGITPPAVTKMLSNSSNLKMHTIAKIATALGCTIEPIKLKPVGKPNYISINEEDGVSVNASMTIPRVYYAMISLDTNEAVLDEPTFTQTINNKPSTKLSAKQRIAA